MAQKTGAGTSTAGARFTDAFVIFSVTVVSLAIGAFLLQRMGLRVWTGLALALAIYAFLLTAHLGLRRIFSSAPKAADEEFDPWAHEKAAVPELSPQFGRRGAPPAQDPLLPQGDPKAEAFSFRPAHVPSLSGYEAPPTKASGLPPPPPPGPGAMPKADAQKSVGGPPEMTVEMIESLVKKLADELNSTPSPPPKVRGKLVPQPAEGEAMLDRSIAALEAAAKSMRATPQGKAAPKPPQLPPTPATAAAAAAQDPAAASQSAAPTKERDAITPQLIRIADALAKERMEVLLEPIQSLTEGRTRHFEISTRLLLADGTAMDQEEVARNALGSGLMPRIDIARIVRAARVARKLGAGGRSGSVLTAIAGESLTDHRFLSTASAEPNTGTMGLVISFQQAEVRLFSPGHVQTLSALAAAGFRFALDGVTDLDMDFAELKGMGFEFVKLDAPVFLEGLPAPSGLVPATDITRMLRDNGLTLVVGRLDDDWQLARVLGLGVMYGRGSLFGAPRLVKQEVVAPPPNAVA